MLLSLKGTTPPAILALADGTVYIGNSIGATGSTVGKVVFNTIAEGEATYHRDGKGVTLKDAEGKDRLRGYGVRTVFAGGIGSRVPASLVGFDEHVF